LTSESDADWAAVTSGRPDPLAAGVAAAVVNEIKTNGGDVNSAMIQRIHAGGRLDAAYLSCTWE